MNPKYHVGDTVRITNMREGRHEKNIGVVIEVEQVHSVIYGELTYYYNVSMQVGKTEYRYWRAEDFLEMVKMKKEAVVFN